VRSVILAFLLLIACSNSSHAAPPLRSEQAPPAPSATAPAPTTQPDTAPYARVLRAYLHSDGRFDYAGLHGDEARMADLHAYVSSVGAARPEAWPRDEQLAFYLNAYNALVLLAVERRWPIDSVMHEDGFFDTDKYTVAGREQTLNELETDVIRGRFHEPRIHFAVNCASLGCPRLWPTPFSARNLERELERRTRVFVRATTTVNREAGRVRVSKLFQWFAPDFGAAGGPGAFVARYLDPEDAAIARRVVIPDFASYDWALNAP